MKTIEHTQTLVTVTCWCGVPHAIPSGLDAEANRTGKAIYCPLGHTWVKSGKGENARLREARDEALRREQALRDLLTQEERSHSATKGQLTKVKKRVSHGVCPHCTRTFQNLARHVKTKHPEECA